jgi:excisionase family DNA binding protein
MPTHPLLTVEEVAQRLHVCTRTIWRWSKSGDMPAPVRLGKSRRIVRWKAVEIDTFLEQVLATLPAGELADVPSGRPLAGLR